jgi:hypothetical protein
VSAERRHDVQRIVVETRSQLATLEIAVAPKNAEVRINGRTIDAPTQTLDPADYVIEVSASGYSPTRREVKLSSGGKETIAIALLAVPVAVGPVATPVIGNSSIALHSPPPAPRFIHTPRGIATVTLAVLDAGTLGTAIALGVLSDKTYDQYRTGCRTACNQSLYNRGYNLAIGADVIWGAFAAISAVTLLTAVIPSRSTPARALAAPLVAPGAAGLGLVGSF